jgi:hypothetical protein
MSPEETAPGPAITDEIRRQVLSDLLRKASRARWKRASKAERKRQGLIAAQARWAGHKRKTKPRAAAA